MGLLGGEPGGSGQRGRRQPGALAAPRTSELARRVRRREAGARSNASAGWDRDGVSKSRRRVVGWLVMVSRCLLHCPLRSTGQWRRQRRPWWCERLTGGAPVAPPRRIRRGARQERVHWKSSSRLWNLFFRASSAGRYEGSGGFGEAVPSASGAVKTGVSVEPCR
jgi:hypothetical protein